ncbi:MAG: efflux RND transporter periplasmic adaptor subunit [Acidobacteriota bacterium]
MDAELKKLRIDRSLKRTNEPSWVKRIIIGGVLLFVLLGAAIIVLKRTNKAVEVEIYHVKAATAAGNAVDTGGVILNATGYIIAAHKIQVASKVNGKVAEILVEKGDLVKQGQVLVRLEDDEYRAQCQQARGELESLKAQLDQALNGSRPEEITQAKANVEEIKADLENARLQLQRTRMLVNDGIVARSTLDDAQARYNSLAARVNSLEKVYEVVHSGPRKEQIESLRWQVEQAKGQLAYFETQLENTVIHAPVSGTVLERNVEKGEFVTTGFASEQGAKGYVISLADLNNLQVELDINQNDFAKLELKQHAIVATDAYQDRKYEGYIKEISPEANRQKATLQIKVQILNPDPYLRPEMNASVVFISNEKPLSSGQLANPPIYIPSSAVRNNTVFLVSDGRALLRAIKIGASSDAGIRVDEGLNGGEELIVNPPENLQNGDQVREKGEQ